MIGGAGTTLNVDIGDAGSTMTMRGNQVVSQGHSPMPAAPSMAGLPRIEQRILPSDFKMQDGLNWPRKLREEANGKVVASLDLGKFKINPSINPKRFDVGR